MNPAVPREKKLLIVTDAWYPQVNGVVTSYVSIIPILEKCGYKVSVIHPGLFWSVPLPFYPEIRLALFARRRVKKTMQKLGHDAVHIATEGPLGFAARRVCRAENILFTTAYHTHFQHYIHVRISMFSNIVYALLRRFHSAAASTMVATESLKQELESHGFQNLVLWPLGVDTDLFVRNPNSSLLALPKPVFVFFSRLAPEKSPEEFLRLQLPGTKLVIGDGPLRASLEKKYGKSARFVGYKRGQELVDWLSLCDVFVFPSRTETFGLVALEALACGIPVAAHDVMGPRDIITNGVDGYISDNLADAAERCLTIDREKCREKALRYSWRHSTTVFLESLIFNARKFQ